MPSDYADFDDMSCEMIFGQDPPMPTEDPAFNQPAINYVMLPLSPSVSTYISAEIVNIHSSPTINSLIQDLAHIK